MEVHQALDLDWTKDNDINKSYAVIKVGILSPQTINYFLKKKKKNWSTHIQYV